MMLISILFDTEIELFRLQRLMQEYVVVESAVTSLNIEEMVDRLFFKVTTKSELF
ncbi:MAG: hypothetical protein AAFN93_12245 [Bacteroidota bacterium]